MAGTWTVPGCPLTLPASAWLQGTAPSRDLDPSRDPEPRQGTAVGVHQGMLFPPLLLLVFLKVQVGSTGIWKEEQHSLRSFAEQFIL